MLSLVLNHVLNLLFAIPETIDKSIIPKMISYIVWMRTKYNKRKNEKPYTKEQYITEQALSLEIVGNNQQAKPLFKSYPYRLFWLLMAVSFLTVIPGILNNEFVLAAISVFITFLFYYLLIFTTVIHRAYSRSKETGLL